MDAVRSRSVAAFLALATIPVGLELSAVAQLTVVVMLLVGMLLCEQVRSASEPPTHVVKG